MLSYNNLRILKKPIEFGRKLLKSDFILFVFFSNKTCYFNILFLYPENIFFSEAQFYVETDDKNSVSLKQFLGNL